jgi:hypothetical protein
MYYKDHNPPHFHAKYNKDEVIIDMDGAVIDGHFLPRALRLVQEWVTLRHSELLENWRRTESGEPLLAIAPLE